MKISISEIGLYQRCPKAYKLQFIDNVEPEKKCLAFCKAKTVRNVITTLHTEKSLKEVSEGDIKWLCEHFWQEEISDLKIDKEALSATVIKAKARSASKEITRGQRCLDEITEWCINYAKREQDSVLLAINMEVEVGIGDAVITGKIDQIREKNGQKHIVILNTSSNSPHENYLARDFRTSLYVYFLWQEEKKIPRSGYYYLPYLERYKKKNGNHKKGDFKGNPFIQTTRSEEDLLLFEYEILQTISQIEMGFFPMRVTSAVGCNICQFAYKC